MRTKEHPSSVQTICPSESFMFRPRTRKPMSADPLVAGPRVVRHAWGDRTRPQLGANRNRSLSSRLPVPLHCKRNGRNGSEAAKFSPAYEGPVVSHGTSGPPVVAEGLTLPSALPVLIATASVNNRVSMQTIVAAL